MATIKDYRLSTYDISNVKASGQNLGRTVYWKLYTIENIVRIIINSILTAQVGDKWWTIAVGKSLQKKVTQYQKKYISQPWHSSPGKHDIYYLGLTEYNEILRDNSHLFLPIIPDVDQWIARLEQVRLPRNVVAHMNWVHGTDRNRINVVYKDIQRLVTHLDSLVSLIAPK